MEGMFYKCGSITSLDLSHFDTKNVKSMGKMFSYCNSLTNLNIADFNIDNCGDTYLTMFDDVNNENLVVTIKKEKENIISLLNDKNITVEYI